MKQWEPDWLQKAIQKIEAAPPRRHRAADSSTVRPRRLDRRLSPEIMTELVDAYRAGASTNQLCEQYSVSKGGLLKILGDRGVKMRCQPMTEGEISCAVKLYSEGQSLNAIARKLGKAKGSVRKALQQRGVEMRLSSGSR